MQSVLEYFNGNDLAANVWSSKYAGEGEQTPDDMHMRMARELFPVMQEFDKKYDLGYVYDLLKDFRYIIPQGSVMATLGVPSKIASLSNCFVVPSPEDSYGGIMLADEHLVQLMKRRGGVGIDISTLRPRGVKVKNAAGTSTGAASFMERFSSSTREVAQDGRRGALMLTIDVRHPDVLEFINAKQDRTKVTGANISVKLRDDFMEAVRKDEDYILRWPCDTPHELDSGFLAPKAEYNTLVKGALGYYKKVSAKDLYEQIVSNAWENAEPGQMFIDRMHDYSPDGIYDKYKTLTTNPCFAYETKILTADGYEEIGSLEGKDIDFINYIGEVVPGTVVCTGVKNTFVLKLSTGEIITTTKDHRFMLTDGSVKEAHQISSSDRLMPFFEINSELNEFVKYGFIQGDGCTGRLDSESHLGMEINIGDKDADIAKLFGVQSGAKHYVNGYNDILRVLGFSSATLPNRTLPSTYDSWSNKDKRMFLKGLWSANGSVITGHRISLKSSCLELIQQLKLALQEFGIQAYYTTNKAKDVTFSNGTYLCKESYDLNITRFESVLQFAKLIGFIHQYKQDSLRNLILAKAPKVISAKEGSEQPVYDFSLFDDTHWGIVHGVVAHNCGEIGMGAYDACRLVAINIFSYVKNPFTASAEFDYEKFASHCYDMQIMGDAIVTLELRHIDGILKAIQDSKEPTEVKVREASLWRNVREVAGSGRRTGCGFTALGDALAALGIKYDSDGGLSTVENMMKTKLKNELSASVDLAKKFGPFSGFFLDAERKGNKFSEMLMEEFPDLFSEMLKYGRRNVSWSTVAPTGTVSLMTQTSSGIEPMFLPFYTRRRKINPSDTNARVDFVDQNGDKWMEYPVLEPKFKFWLEEIQKVGDSSDMDTATVQKWFEKSPWYGSCASDIDWTRRVDMQAIVQKYTTHSISSTINLPNSATKEDVGEIYARAWDMGLKGVTVYRDGCRTGVLVSQSGVFSQHNAPKRPKKLTADIYHTTAVGQRWTVCVGLLEDKPYEVFATRGEYGTHGQRGEVYKNKKKHYTFAVGEDIVNSDITATMSGEEAALTRLISTALRHGTKVDFVIDQLSSAEGPIVSFSKAIARTLKKYAEEKSLTCLECGSDSLEMKEGCMTCKNCGNSKCG